MISFDAGAIVRAIVSLRQLESAVVHYQDNEHSKKTDPLHPDARAITLDKLTKLDASVANLDVKVTKVTIDELVGMLKSEDPLSYQDEASHIATLGSTLRKELGLMKSFCLEDSRQRYFEVDFQTFGQAFEARMPSAIFEIDESGKCLALSRSTASVFHAMRAMEVGLKAVAASLNIADPTKDGEKNWGSILRRVKGTIDTKTDWKNGADKSFFLDLYASLDAVRSAWRNSTMHVENKYTEDEAEHIFIAVRGFMKRLCSRIDEQGQPAA